MELSSSNIQKILILSQKKKKLFLSSPKRKLFLFPETELSCSNTKKNPPIFSQKKYFLIFTKVEPCTFHPKP